MVAANTVSADTELDRGYGPRVRRQEEDRLLTKAELAHKLGLPGPRAVEVLVQKRRIPVCVLGYRTHRFDYTKVKAALERLTIHEVGAQ